MQETAQKNTPEGNVPHNRRLTQGHGARLQFQATKNPAVSVRDKKMNILYTQRERRGSLDCAYTAPIVYPLAHFYSDR